LQPTLAGVLQSLGLAADATVATVTAGWQEREDDDRELREHLGDRAVNLYLYRRAEAVFARDPEFARAVSARQDELRKLQTLYRIRLQHAMNACLELLRRPGAEALLREERRLAIEALRDLDASHVGRVATLHAEFDERWKPEQREPIARECLDVTRIVNGTAAVAIAGGHVVILLNRLRMFGLPPLLDGKLVVAWSAGAMAVAERVVLFHDDPPHGAGHAEVLGAGLNLAPGLVPLPHARRRLKLDDPLRVLTLARRMAPAACVPMDEGARADWDGEHWALPPGTRRLGLEGTIDTWAA
jgi:hypothetical protein